MLLVQVRYSTITGITRFLSILVVNVAKMWNRPLDRYDFVLESQPRFLAEDGSRRLRGLTKLPLAKPEIERHKPAFARADDS
jgi:hypothetical protein